MAGEAGVASGRAVEASWGMGVPVEEVKLAVRQVEVEEGGTEVGSREVGGEPGEWVWQEWWSDWLTAGRGSWLQWQVVWQLGGLASL